jgi:membrane protein DedA with SNARE-associated domain
MPGTWIASLLAFAGHSLLLQAATIILATFILEDAATVIAAMEAAQGTISIAVALTSLFVGIVLGDLGLYGLGRVSTHIRWIARRLPPHRTETINAWLRGRVFQVVFISRFLPGLRLPTYTTCGFLGADLRQFTLAAIVATTCWTSMLFGVSLRVGHFLMDHFGAWRWLGAAGFVVFVIIAGRLAAAGLQSERR